jgi:hypothetical protein
MHERSERQPTTDVIWRPCPWCWGSRRIIVTADFGAWAEICPHCLGVGEAVQLAPRTRDAKQLPPNPT